MRFPVVLFDLDGTVVDSGAIILASMRHATRTVLEREIPDDELMAAVGGPGPRGADARVRAGARRRARARLPRAQRAAARRARGASPGMDDVLVRLQGRGPAARHRHGEAPRDRRARVRARAARAPLRRRRRRRRDRARRSRTRSRCCSRSSASAREPADAAYVGDSPFDMQAAQAAGVLRRRRHAGAASTSATRSADADVVVDTRGGAPCRPLSPAARAAELRELLDALEPRLPRPRRPERRRRDLRPPLRRARRARGGAPGARHARLADAARRRAAVGARSGRCEHLAPMGSLEKVTTDEALAKWADDVRKRLDSDEPVAYVIEPKIDGLAINLTYEDGVLVARRDARRRRPGRGRDRRTCARSRRSRCGCSATTRRRCSRCAARSTCRSPASAR